MRALITGADGFIGGAVFDHLAKTTDHEVLGIGRKSHRTCDKTNGVWTIRHNELAHTDILNIKQVREVMRVFNPDVIFHMAGNPNVKLGVDDPDGRAVWKTNVDGTYNLLTEAPAGCRFVLASSATVYGDSNFYFDEDTTTAPGSVYAASKVAGEALVCSFTYMGRVRGCSLRYVATVGAGATHGCLPDIIRKAQDSSMFLNLWGDKPGSVKPYMHVSDVGAITARIGTTKSILKGKANVAPHNSISIEDIANIVQDVVGSKKPLHWEGSNTLWQGDQPHLSVDGTSLSSLYGPYEYKWSESAIRQATMDILETQREHV